MLYGISSYRHTLSAHIVFRLYVDKTDATRAEMLKDAGLLRHRNSLLFMLFPHLYELDDLPENEHSGHTPKFPDDSH